MTSRKRKIYSVATIAVAVFLWDLGLYLMTNEFVAKLFLVIILVAGVWIYYELKHAAVEPSLEDSTEKSNSTEIEMDEDLMTDEFMDELLKSKNTKPIIHTQRDNLDCI